MYPRFTGEQNRCQPLSTGAHLLTPPATQDGLRPFAQVTCHFVPRLWAPGEVFKPSVCASNGAPYRRAMPFQARHLGRRHQSVRMQEAGGRRWKQCNREPRTPERKVGTSTDAPVVLSGVLRGWADCEHGAPLAPCRTGGAPPKPPFGSFRAVPKGTRLQAKPGTHRQWCVTARRCGNRQKAPGAQCHRGQTAQFSFSP